MEKQIEQTLDSREVAEMIGKEHHKLMRDLRRYEIQFNQSNIGFVDFFRESTYEDSKGETRPCYSITKKGCEFIAHKLTGTKGTAFTARYINRFHEMEDIIITADQAAVQAQGKILDNISRRLAASIVIGSGSRTEQDMYKTEIVRMVESMKDRDALCKVYTFAKYVPVKVQK